MRILHTSDWHLGRTLHGVDLLDHQAAYFDHLVEVVRSEQVGAVVVSGDVYDRAIPPVEAVMLLSQTLSRLAEHTQVVVTPGNHDSAIRLGFAAQLLRDDVHLRTRVADVGQPVALADPAGGAPVMVYALPYLDPDAARTALREDGGEPLGRSHEAVMGAAMRRVRADLERRQDDSTERLRSLVMAHAFVIGGDASESERDIRVGGVDSVPAGTFAGVDYVALGHLHGPQRVTCPGTTVGRYSGSPLAYSFSEMRHAKSTVLVELGADGVTGEPELLAAPVPRRLTEVTGTIDDLLGAAGEGHHDDWVRLVVTDPRRPQEMNARLKERFPHALVMMHRPAGERQRESLTLSVTAASDPVAVAGDFITHVTGLTPSPLEADVLRKAFEAANATDRSA